ncbi:MAG: DUF3570 domain-containing protein [Myxococcales bacterium]|nr:DUF3570 domain-containing protein [Myxococcales bacterium]
MRLQLIAACCAVALLAAPASADPGDEGTQLSSDILVYVDDDNVSVVSPQVGVRHPLDEDGGEVSSRVVLDAITAASVDVISNATYRFSELRTEVNVAGSKSVRGYLPSLSYRLSNEPDYVSHSFGMGLSRDFAGGDTTVSGSYNLSLDTVGRAGTPSSVFSESLQSHSAEIGATQVIDTKTLLRVVYSLTVQDGYMEKPYRSVPIFDGAGLQLLETTGSKLGLGNFDVHRLAFKPAEEVPDSRYRHAAALRGLRYFDSLGASLRLDYRLYGDSWGMFGHTVETAFSKAFESSLHIESWARVHYQGGVDFWRRTYSVNDATSLPSLRTTDKSLSPYWQGTGGLRVGWAFFGFEAYAQSALMYSSFLDHLFIDSRIAIMSQGGLRWHF